VAFTSKTASVIVKMETSLSQLCHNFATCPTSCPSLPNIYIYTYLYKKFEELLLSHIKSPSAHVENQNVSLFLLVSRPQLNISQTTAGSLRLTPSNCASSGANCHSCHCQKSRTRNMCLNNSKYTNALQQTSYNQESPAFFLSLDLASKP
jgi:hypothetical protein